MNSRSKNTGGPACRSRESGNVFIIIMMGIALFAALMFTFSRGVQEGTGKLSKKQAEMAAIDIISYGRKMERAINRLRRNNCSENQITFEDNADFSRQKDGTPYNYTNANSPGDFSCHVFNANGGKMTPQLIPPDYAVDPSLIPAGWLDPQSFLVTGIRVVGLGTESGASGTELIFWVGRLTNDVCMAINDKLGISNPSGAPPVDSWDNSIAPFTGAFADISNPVGDTITELQGKDAFCVAYDNSGLMNNFMQVLIIR